MAFRSNFSLLLYFFSLHLLLVSFKICSHDCPSSSCGSIRNISYPFRLKDDPKHCGEPSYELVCENDRTTLYLNSKRFIVLSITYPNFTIRLVDPGLEKYQGYSSCPLHYLVRDDLPRNYLDYIYYFNDSDIYLNSFLIFFSCSSQINTNTSSGTPRYDYDGVYHETSLCCDNLSNSSFSAKPVYSYVFCGSSLSLGEMKDSCSVKKVTMVSKSAPAVRNSQFSNYSYGFELLWYPVLCGRCYVRGLCFPIMVAGAVVCRKYGNCRFSNPSSFRRVWCWKVFFFEVIWWVYSHTYALRFIVSVGGILAARFFLGILFLFVLVVHKIRRRHLSMYETIENFLQGQNNLVPIRYSYAEVKKMTNNFRDKLGEGGYGTVFKGKLRSGMLVAVKIMGESKASGEEFISEVATIGRIHHVNVVNLIGFCFEGSKRALVYEFMPNGSLEKYIFPQGGEMIFSSWEKMFKISLGVARGMDYLHRGCEMQILHFDIKPHNILLDENFNPKISDFGLAKLYPAGGSIVSLTAARGTMGYMAPELFYKNIGRVSYKADVYSFGMLLMEMAGKRKNLNPFVDHLSQIYFPSWVHDQFSQGKEIEMGDATEDERKVVKKMILVALWCIQMTPTDRPSMNKVVEMLEGDLDLLEMPPKPFLSPERMQDDHQDHEIDTNNAELPLLSTSYKDSGSLDGEL